jgi:hypothetical protein
MFVAIWIAFGYAVVLPLSAIGARGDVLTAFVFTAGALVATYVLTRFINRKPFASVGLWFHASALPEFLWGCLLGFLMMAGVFLVMLSAGIVEVRQQEMGISDILIVLGSSFLVFGLGAAIEEIVFRGYPFQTLVQGITLLPATILMALLFAAAHLGNPNTSFVGITNVGLAAIWLSVAYVKTKGLWLPFGLHFSWNFSQTTIFSFRTSGIEFAENRVFLSTVSGPDWLTGGSFGPEGGVLATISLIACTWYVLKSDRFRPQPGVITLDSIEDIMPVPDQSEKA